MLGKATVRSDHRLQACSFRAQSNKMWSGAKDLESEHCNKGVYGPQVIDYRRPSLERPVAIGCPYIGVH